MKKLLSLLAAVGLTATSSATVIACDTGTNDGTGSTDGTNIGEIANIYSETILKAAESKIKNFKAADYEVYSYNQTSAQLIQKKSVATSTKFEPVTVTYTIKALDLSENNKSLVANILVGNMDKYGVVDQTQTIANVMANKKITKESIITSFAQMNGTFINESDIEIGDINWEAQTVTIKSKNQDVLKGTDDLILYLNNDINSANLLRDLNVGTIYLPGSFYDMKSEYFTKNENAMTSYPLIFQNLGDRNKLFAYLSLDLAQQAFAILGEIGQSETPMITETSAKFSMAYGGDNNSLVKSGIISKQSQEVTINYNIAQDNRVIVGEYIPEAGLSVTAAAYDSGNQTTVIKEIYAQLNEEFKKLISEEVFIKYATIHFLGKDNEPTIEFLPGGDYIYAMNAMAYMLISGAVDDDKAIPEKFEPPLNKDQISGYVFSVK